MYSQSEVVNLIIGLAVIPILISSRGGVPSRHTNWFVGGYLLMLVSYSSTVAEGYFAPTVLNAIEHGALALAGCVFALALILRRRELAQVLKGD